MLRCSGRLMRPACARRALGVAARPMRPSTLAPQPRRTFSSEPGSGSGGAGGARTGGAGGSSGAHTTGGPAGGPASSGPQRRTPIGWISLGLTTLSAGGLYMLYRQQLELKLRNAKTVGTASLGGPFELVDANGRTVTDTELRGRFVLLYFGFTKCPDICPDELEKLSEVTRRIDAALGVPAHADESFTDSYGHKPTLPVFVTIDPLRDTPARLRAYFGAPPQPPAVAAAAAAAAPSAAAGSAGAAAGADEHGFSYHPRLLPLTGNQEQIDAVARAYRIYTSKPTPDEVRSGEYLLDHSIIIYLLAPDGVFLSFYGRNFSAQEVAAKALAEMAKWNAEHAQPQSVGARLLGAGAAAADAARGALAAVGGALGGGAGKA